MWHFNSDINVRLGISPDMGAKSPKGVRAEAPATILQDNYKHRMTLKIKLLMCYFFNGDKK